MGIDPRFELWKYFFSLKGWQRSWFYLRASDLPAYNDRVFKAPPKVWAWGPVEEEKKRLGHLLNGIVEQKEKGLDGVGVVGTFFARAVAPLGARAKPMFRGATDAGASVLTQSTNIPDAEVIKRLRRVLNVPAAT